MTQVLKGPKDFDVWNDKKKQIHFSVTEPVYFKEREIWWCALGANVGVETDGKNDNFERPVLIVKRFNRDMIWIVPITSTVGDKRFYHPIKYGPYRRWLILSQLKTISSKRLLRKVDFLPLRDFLQVSEAITSFLYRKSETPP
ncbi:MAG: type II toxin-antitoxin system PemK/MazF family toxin [Candidatus Vogelbacteria bacterium]|nr:type II toxin-antitoxin system PemK/MazF family toxin [Candidatus Vogelbacteria bacterium]